MEEAEKTRVRAEGGIKGRLTINTTNGRSSMAAKGNRLPWILRVHNRTCPAWLLRIGFMKKIEPGCRAATKRLSG